MKWDPQKIISLILSATIGAFAAGLIAGAITLATDVLIGALTSIIPSAVLLFSIAALIEDFEEIWKNVISLGALDLFSLIFYCWGLTVVNPGAGVGVIVMYTLVMILVGILRLSD